MMCRPACRSRKSAWSAVELSLRRFFFSYCPPFRYRRPPNRTGKLNGKKPSRQPSREGKVVVSVPTSAELRKELEAGFQKKFPGIALELSVACGASNINRIVEEQKAGVRNYDLHIGGTTSIITGPLAQHLLEPIMPLMILLDIREA